MKDLGYCVTSRKYGIVSRIDREDWRDYMASKLGWKVCEDTISNEDYYRRCISKDDKEIGQSKARKFPKSGSTKTGFVK